MFKELKVIELASVLAGPLVGTFFSELGASVCKIENKTTGGDVTRKWKLPSEKSENISAYYAAANFNKETLFLDFRNKNDYNKTIALIKQADIVIANFKFGDAKKLKLDYETLKKINPLVIYGEITGYGKNVNRSAFDVVLQAETGFMAMNGTAESGPIKMPVALIDVLAAHQLKEALLCSLIKKIKTNKGSYVSVSLFDTAISSLANQATNWLIAKHIPQAMGSQHPNIAPYGDMFKTKDEKFIVLAIGSNKQYKLLCELLDLEDLINNELFKTNKLRVSNRQELNKLLQEKFMLRESDFWVSVFIEKNIPAGVIKNLKEVFEEKAAQNLVIEEKIDGNILKKVKTVVFEIL